MLASGGEQLANLLRPDSKAVAIKRFFKKRKDKDNEARGRGVERVVSVE